MTATNGKTTTTRCLAHILASTGRRVGMANSNGVWIAGEQVLDGDYTGPQGSRRVLEDPSVEVAVLETARGGILLRGIAYESNDVGVVTNVSADHLGLQGIDTVEQLADVKSLVVRLTRPGGAVVLNGDDPLVRAMAAAVAAPVTLFSRLPDSEPVQTHLAAGGRAVIADNKTIVIAEGTARSSLIPLADVPITFGGRAAHMVENALAATAAALGLGLPPDAIAAGLTSFRNTPEQNFGRLHVFAIREPACTFIVDYAHNEAGLGHLLRFGASYVAPGGRLLAIVGTAGDRPDSVLRGLGHLAGEQAAYVWIRETEHFLRGRTREEMNALFVAGIIAGSGTDDAHTIVPDELTALDAALAQARPGDAIVMMCFEQQADVLAALGERGTLE
jgi:cyanophycin synthetase